MNRDDVSWHGYWPACPTPFARDGSVDTDALRNLLDWYIGEGLHGVLINGTTGEWFSQSADERKLVAETAIEHVAGRVPVVVGCTAYTAREAAQFGRHAAAAGAAGIASTAPPYSKPYDDEIFAYYSDLSAGCDAPLAVYNWPHGTSVEIGPDLAERLAEIDTVVLIKDSTPDAQQFYETSRRVVDRVRVFGPYMTTEGFGVLRESGGDGTIGGGSLYGAPDAEFWEAYWRGDHDLCLEHAARIDELFPKLWLPGGWGGHWGAYQSQLKAIMKMLGQPGGEVRPPRLPVDDKASLAAIRAVLDGDPLLSLVAQAA
ncbi:MAG: dihydrodipicolinate synthase family protein [Actinomycetota bacterium]